MGYHKSVLAVVKSRFPDIDVDTDHNWPEDVCLVRARMAYYAKREGYDRVMFWDSDISMGVDMFLAIARSKHDFAAGLYVNAGGRVPFRGEPKPDGEGWAPVTHVPLGAASISMWALDQVATKAGTFTDVMPGTGERIETPDLFAHLYDSRNERLSEDFSFCERALRAGVCPRIFLGDTATHWKMVPLKM